jgi:hypothetical protein
VSIDFPCVCGHKEDDHVFNYHEAKYCIACFEYALKIHDSVVSPKSMWHEFQVDNLRYLEEKTDE